MEPARFYYRDPQAPAPTRLPSAGVVALIERDGALLLDCREDCGRWALVGGGVDANESLGDALRREVREETGLTVRHFSLFGTFSDPSRIVQRPDGEVRRTITLAYLVEVEPFDQLRRSDESLALRFVPRDELAHLDIVETHRHIVEDYLYERPVVLK
jgi:ADP-ribose pyrophosphatase YjhB (NUDIX family)